MIKEPIVIFFLKLKIMHKKLVLNHNFLENILVNSHKNTKSSQEFEILNPVFYLKVENF